MSEIIINITKDGKATVEALNFEGSSCSLATQPYVNALGIKDGELPKPEMFAEEKQKQGVSQ